jgi:hypothetical protein
VLWENVDDSSLAAAERRYVAMKQGKDEYWRLARGDYDVSGTRGWPPVRAYCFPIVQRKEGCPLPGLGCLATYVGYVPCVSICLY